MSKKSLSKQVEMCLNEIPETRNSDITLMIAVWQNFYGVTQDVTIKRLYELPREDNIKRIRAKFNSEGKFLPTTLSVALKRKISEKEWQEYLGYN